MRQLESTAIAAGLSADDVEAINEEFTRQLAVEAWSDGIITDEERATLLSIAEALGVDPALVHSLLDDPLTGPTPSTFTLHPGDRVAFTGALTIPRDTWTERATAAGLDVGGVTKTCAVLVAANPDSMSGKAKKARENGVPIIGETRFAQLLKAVDDTAEAAAPAGSGDAAVAAAPVATASVAAEAPEQFSWLTPDQVRTTGASSARIAAAWIALHPDRPLHELADNLQPHHVPEATGAGIDRYLAVWSLHHPEMLSVSANDLLDLPGVGPKRRSQLVEMVVDLAADGVEEPASAPVPQQDPTELSPEELLAAAHAPRYTPVPTTPTQYNVTPMEPATPPRKRPNPSTVFKWSAGIGVLCFFLFGLCLETFDPEAESFIAGVFAMGFLMGGLTAAISGAMTLIGKFRN